MRRFKIVVALFLATVAAIFFGCASDGSTGAAGSGSFSGAPTAGASSGPLFGKLYTLPALLVLNQPSANLIQTLQTQAQARGINFVLDQGVGLFPPAPASGWLIRVGSFETVSAFDGSFQLPAGLSGSGEIIHPSGSQKTTFQLSALSGSAEAPRSLVIPQPFRGPCGMSEGDTDTFCVPQRVAPRASSEIQARFQPAQWVQPANPRIPSYGVRTMERGTYPPPHDYIVHHCPDSDGPFLPDNEDEKIRYLGSTCNYNVLDGACPNENPISDQEYQQFASNLGFNPSAQIGLGSLVGVARRHIELPFQPELLTPPINTGLFDTNCLLNHGGRVCGMFQLGDISIDAGTVTRAGETIHLKVIPGAHGELVVHNNGVFGYTDIARDGDAVVSLNSPDMSNHDLHQLLRHFDLGVGQTPPHYQADRTVSYQVSPDAGIATSTGYTFTVDDRRVRVVFDVGGAAINPDTSSLLPTGSQLFTAQHPPAAPGETFTYEWTLAQFSGILTPNARAVTYTPDPNRSLPFQDTLTLRVFLQKNGGLPRLYATATASIFVQDVGAIVTPGVVDRHPGESQGYTVDVQGQPPGATLSYQWSSTNSLGSFSPDNQASTSFTVNPNITQSTNETLNVQVFITDNQGTRLFTTGHALVRIQVTSNNWASGQTNPDQYQGIAFGTQQFVILGQSVSGSFVLISNDHGTTWQRYSLPGVGTIQNVRFLDGQFVAVIQAGSPTHTEVMTSPDGIVWTNRGSTGGVFASDVAFLNGTYVVAGDGGSFIAHTANLASSTDLIHWTDRGLPGGLNSVKALGSGFVAVGGFGGGGRILTSLDGISWTTQTSGTSAELDEAAWDGHRLVVVGNDTILYSDDGSHWLPATFSSSNNLLERVEFGNGRFRAVGRHFGAGQTPTIFSSADGINWTPDNFPSFPLNGVDIFRLAFGDGYFLATTRGGEILHNP
ncbi:MAG: hypothetical protein U0931_21090 [Vulcanimicrobiota bacterium]